MASNTNHKMLFIVNPVAGRAHPKNKLTHAVKLFKSHGYSVTMKKTASKGHATELVIKHGTNYDIIVCNGGDGTLNEVISGVMNLDRKVTIGYIPSGTTNDFASSLNLSDKTETAAMTILTGQPRTVDIGLFGEKRYFSYIASFGAFTGSSYSTPQSYKNVIGHLAYVLDGMRDIPNIRPHHVCVEVDGQTYEDDYLFGAVSNSISIGGLLKLDSNKVNLNDGLFEIILIKNPKTPLDLSRMLLSIRKKEYTDKSIQLIKASEATFYMDEVIPWSIDGEYEPGANKVRIQNISNAISIIV
ncbi:MAG: diacylglycerol kinase family lipid kinase [Clostridiales bacterium]|jgi:diacylglycerol kinase (ATP)|nr:diacylglycerol kinase family lipid kinase [Clostridiales bacterium]